MSRQTIARVLLALLLVGTLSACATSPTAPDGQGKPKDSLPWN